ncbi:MAG: adenylate/guanylate cyclase domain-containing protein [Mariprofundales bacterium]|nr:adenylate/guanylate cyclase domain-containing protein [Mariprofundales bacterium]
MEISWDQETRQQRARWRARIPLRWQWGVFIAFAILMSVSGLTVLVLKMEQQRWADNEQQQATLMVQMIRNAVKLPMVGGDSRATQRILGRVIKDNHAIKQIYLRWRSGAVESYGEGTLPPRVTSLRLQSPQIDRINIAGLWFATAVTYSDTPLGTLIVRFSGRQWRDALVEMRNRMLMISALILCIAWIGTWVLARRLSKPLEQLAQATRRVAKGDLSVALPVTSNDEIGDVTSHFNRMVVELEHKERIRDRFGKYLHPELVATLFEEGDQGPVSQKREVTILFADMVDFTNFSHSLPPERVVMVINQFFSLFHSVITTFDGHVDKYIGDAVMAVFNHPFAHKRHVEQAALAGLAMAQICQRLDLQHPNGSPIAFRIGINRGEVIIGNIGASSRMEFTLIGDAVNIASRMAGIGKGNQLIAPVHSFRGTRHDFELRELGRLRVKGLEQPLECVRVVARAAELRQQVDDAVESAFARVAIKPQLMRHS